MASPAINPTPSAAGGPPPQGGAPGAAGGAPPTGGASGGPRQWLTGDPLKDLANLALFSQGIASESSETAPMMREVQNQVRQATMKAIQQRQATQQATPQI